MCRGSFFLLFFCFLLSPASPQAQRQYLITEAELQSIENLSQSWEKSRLDWLSQVSMLKAELVSLQTVSKTLVSKLEVSQGKSIALQAELVTLNKALAAERQLTAALRKSFDEYEHEKLSQLNSLAAALNSQEIKTLEAEKKASWWQLLAIVAIGAIIAFVVIALVFLRKK